MGAHLGVHAARRASITASGRFKSTVLVTVLMTTSSPSWTNASSPPSEASGETCLPVGDTVISTKNDSSGSKIGVQSPKE
jgi:hypothetical protein